jgi:hypothetical protein
VGGWPDFTGRGYGAESVRLMAGYGFHDGAFHDGLVMAQLASEYFAAARRV